MRAVAQTIQTTDGPFTVLMHPGGAVLASGWNTDPDQLLRRIHPSLRPDSWEPGQVDAVTAVEAYYAGDLQAVTPLPVLQVGTELQEAGWVALRNTPAGNTLTYAEFARRIERPNAVRAAASICARNAAGLFTPCHRVLASDGSLGGFAWGTEVKRSLLDREARDNRETQTPLY